jgi:hypothetical protein
MRERWTVRGLDKESRDVVCRVRRNTGMSTCELVSMMVIMESDGDLSVSAQGAEETYR